MTSPGVPPLVSPMALPVDPATRRDRMMRFVKARADTLRIPVLDDHGRVVHEGLPERAALLKAAGTLPGFIAGNPDQHGALRAYLEGGTEDLPEGWLVDTSVQQSPETVRHESMVQRVMKNREESPVAAAVTDYVFDPALRFYGGVGQTIADVGVGLVNMLGTEIEAPEVKSAFAAAVLQLTGQGADSFGETYDITKEGLKAVAETGGTGSGILRGAGDVAGFVRGLGMGATAKGGTIIGSPAMVMRAGGALGALAGRMTAIVTKMKPAGKLAGFTERMGQGVGAFGALGTVTAKGEDGGAPTWEERGENALHEGFVGAVIGGAAETGKMIVRGLLKMKVGDMTVADRAVVTAMKDWAVKTKKAPLKHETQERFRERVLNEWLDGGAQGAQIPFGLRGARLAIRGGSESIGMSLLDEQFRGNLLSGAWKDDPEVAAQMIETLAGTALGLAMAHGKVTDLPGLQRRMPTERSAAKPATEVPQESAQPQEPVREPGIQAPGEPVGQPTEMGGGVERGVSYRVGQAGESLTPPRERAIQDLFRKHHFDRHGWAAGKPWADAVQNVVRLGWEPRANKPAFPGGVPLLEFSGDVKPPSASDAAALEAAGQGPTQTVEVRGTKLSFDVSGDMARPSPELREVLGLREAEMPVADLLPLVEKASLLASLRGKALLPGTDVSAESVKATEGEGEAPPIMRRIAPNGEAQQAEASANPDWKPAESFPARGKDALDEPQQMAVEALKDVLNNRSDLAQPDRVMLSDVIEVLDTVAAKGDRSVAETMEVMDEVLPALAQTPPKQAGKLIKLLAESLTTKHPDVAIEDLARGQEMQREQALAEAEFERADAAAKAAPEPKGSGSSRYTNEEANAAIKAFEDSGAAKQFQMDWWKTLVARGQASGAVDALSNMVGTRLTELDRNYMHEADYAKQAGTLDAQIASLKEAQRRLSDIGVAAAKRMNPGLFASFGENATEFAVTRSKEGEPTSYVGGKVYSTRAEAAAEAERLGARVVEVPKRVADGREGEGGHVTIPTIDEIAQAAARGADALEAMGKRLRDMLTVGEGDATEIKAALRSIDEKRTESSGGMEMYGGIPVPREVLAIAKGGAKGTGEIGGSLWNKFQRQIVREVGDLGLKDVEEIGRAAVSETKLFAGRHENSGLYRLRRTPRKAMSGLANDMVEDAHGAGAPRNAILQDPGLERHFGKQEVKNSEEQQVLDDQLGVFQEGGRIAEELGIKVGKDGTPFKYDPNRRRFVRILTNEGRDAVASRRGPLYEKHIGWLQQHYRIDRAEAERRFLDTLAVGKLDATETRRVFDVVPTHYKIGGRWVAMYETDPVLHAERMANTNAHVMGARSALPRDFEKVEGLDAEVDPLLPPLPDAAQHLVNKANKEHGPVAARAVARLMRSLHGMSVEGREPFLGLQPGSHGYHLVKVVNGFLGLNKAAMLSAAGLTNIIEPIANSPYLGGVGAVMRSYANVTQAFTEGRIGEVHRRLVTEGVLADNKENLPLRGDNNIETFENGMRKAGDLITTPLRITQSLNELVIADAALTRLEAMREGNGGNGDRSLLKAMGFSEAEAVAMADGRGTEAQYDRYKKSVVGTLAGGRSAHGAEKSLASHSRNFNALVWFTNFFQARSQLVDSLWRDFKQSSGEDRHAKLAQMVKVAGFTTASGALIQMLRELFKNGVDGPADYLRESVSGSAGNVALNGLEILSSGVLGGLGQPILNAFGSVGEGGTWADTAKDTMYRLIGPAGSTVKLVDFVTALSGGDVPGYENKSRIGMVAQYGRNLAPAAKMIHEGLFGISAFAFTQEDQDLDEALDSMNRWERDNGRVGRGGNREQSSRAFRDSMRAIVTKVREGKFYGDEDLMEAVVAAQVAHLDQTLAAGLTEPGGFQKAKQAVASSLRGQRSMPRDRDRTMTQAKRDSMAAHLGEKHLAALQDYDMVLDMLAERIAPSSR